MSFIFINKKLGIYFRCDLSSIDTSFNNTITFTRKKFEEKLEKYFEEKNLCYTTFKTYQHPTQREQRKKREGEFEIKRHELKNVNTVFISGGTCRIPFIQRWIKKQFPNANFIMDNQIEIITATGAAIHALQVINDNVTPYVKIPPPPKNNKNKSK